MKIKLKRVNNSKEPTTEQMLRMAKNLQRLYKKACHIDSGAWCFVAGNTKIHYDLYVASITGGTQYFKTWPELMQYYRKLIKEGLNGTA